MKNPFRRSFRTRIAAILFFFLSIVIVHQLSYTNDVALASPISDSIKILAACPIPNLEASNDTFPRNVATIPNLVHQIWKTADLDTYPIEASHESWNTSFEHLNYTVKLWTEDDVLRLIKRNYSWLLQTYEGYPQNIQRADVARLVVIHAEGGMYADLDVYPTSVERIICVQIQGLQAAFAPTGGTRGLSNHFFMAERGSPFIMWALQEAKRRGSTSKRIALPYLQVFWSTGPMMVTSAYRQYIWMYNTAGYELGVLEESFGGSVVRHKAGRSWHQLDGLILNWIADNVQTESKWLIALSLTIILGLIYRIARR
ncbi:nucleotide-diphospho-sugar transferase [Thelonectria olida]|uniref:Nucleotide-diphospho-sugar transferase n=1 Tax=Thelonectria olida TaxID=1576542 RepID=A0A9P8W147_9HYPO|nr:nucleotide-diphospho-sugar transferase [Thelonectria olida]